jgi:hypothetical protein
MKQKLLIIILTVLAFSSCKLGTSGVWKNDHIDKDKREQIKMLNDKLFKGLINNDVSTIKSLFSDSLLKNSMNNIDALINQFSNSNKATDYRLLDEYYLKSPIIGNITTFPSWLGRPTTSEKADDNDYVIQCKVMNKEMYVSAILTNGKDNDILIFVVYGKFNNEWKINILQFGQYSVFGKTSPDYYKIAKDKYEKSYLIDAVNYISIAKLSSKPAGVNFQYRLDKDINEFYEKVMKEVNSKYQFPFTLDNIPGKPKVFRIFPEMINDGFYPMVYYITDINLNDTTALKLENERVKKEVGRLFTGIDQDKKFVYYWAFNEIPDGQKLVEHYSFIDQRTK